MVRDLRSGKERVVVEGVNPYFIQPLWVSNEELLFWGISEHIVSVNIANNEKKDIGFEGFEPYAVSPDGKKVITVERRGEGDSKIYLLDLEQRETEFIKRVSRFSPQGTPIWAPDGKSFVYTRQGWRNLLPFHEIGNLYWYDLATKREIKLADTVSLSGGFWLAQDPAAKTEVKNPGKGLDV